MMDRRERQRSRSSQQPVGQPVEASEASANEPQRGPAPAQNTGDGGNPNAACHPKPTDWSDGDDAQQDGKPPCPEGYEDRQPESAGEASKESNDSKAKKPA